MSSSLILYGSPQKLTNAHLPVTFQRGAKKFHQPRYFVRAHLVHVGIDAALSLSGRFIMEGETVLNTVPIDESTK